MLQYNTIHYFRNLQNLQYNPFHNNWCRVELLLQLQGKLLCTVKIQQLPQGITFCSEVCLMLWQAILSRLEMIALRVHLKYAYKGDKL